MTEKKLEKRKKDIVKLIEKRLTYNQVGKMYGISRQRVHQIVKEFKNPKPKKPYTKLDIMPKTKVKIDKLNIARITGMSSGSRDRVRELIRIRDNHTCQICGKVWKTWQRRLDVHHIDCVKEKTNQCDNYEKEKDNMITLCHKCHLNLPEHRQTMALAAEKKLST